MPEFSHIHGHTFHSNWSGPDALSSPKAVVSRAAELGLESICITDHASISGIPDFAEAAKAAGIKPVVGSELYVCTDPAWRPGNEKEDGEASEEGRSKRDYNHVVCIARNWDGFIELCGLISKASSDPNFYRRPRNSFDDLYATKNLIFSTACAGGLLKRADYCSRLAEFRDAVGTDRLFLEIQPHLDAGQRLVNERAVEMRDQLGLKLVASQDFHYAKPGDNNTHEVMLAIGSSDTMSNPDRWKYPVDDLFIKNKADMVRAFMPWVSHGILTPDTLRESFASADDIVAQTAFEWHDMPVSLPPMADDINAAAMRLCIDAMKRKGLEARPEYIKRLASELRVLIDANILNYFLILHDIISWSRAQGIMVGPGRGSAGGSLVAYLLGVTTIDPIYHGLIFERFYRPGRVDLPDIDTDFEDERREDVLAYIERRFGKDNVANVASYTKLKARGALKDVARTYEIGHIEANHVTQAIQVADIQIDDDDAIAAHNEEVLADPAVAAFFKRYPVIEPHVRALTGFMRGTGQHAAGIVIAGVPVAERAAVMRAKGDRRVVCWDKRTVEKMGLMKLDILGLRTMAILRNAADNVRRSRGKRIVYEDLPLDDDKTLALFDAGDTTGVFQCESRGMRAVFKECNVDRFQIISDIISLYRPGPMELIPRYQSAQTGKMTPAYRHPLLEPILAETAGVLIYQEQLMRIFVDMGGFDYAHADKMRKIVGKKLGPDEFRKHTDDFVAGAILKGVAESVARETFDEMVRFAGYAFNKSHAVAYAVIAYWCAFMKANYPAEFWAAHLSSTDDDDKLALAIKDVTRERIVVLPPDINQSAAGKFVPINDATIMAPLTAIKGLGEKQAEMIVGAREGRVDPNGLYEGERRVEAKRTVEFDRTLCVSAVFTDAADFEKRVYARIVNKRIREALEATGSMPWKTLDESVLKANRRELLGHVFQEIITVDTNAYLLMDEFTVPAVHRLMEQCINPLQAETKVPPVMPASGGKPRIMVVFPRPEYSDPDKGMLGNGNGWKKLYQLMQRELFCQPKDFYLTSLYRFYKPPLGDARWHDQQERVLREEIETLKPPVIMALGKEAVEFFAGKGTKMGAVNGTVRVINDIPVIFGISPIQVVMEPGKEPELLKSIIALKEMIV